MTHEDERLEAAVRAALPGADREHIALVTAVTGLLGAVAHADRNYAPEERKHIEEQLVRIDGVDERAARAIVSVLERHLTALSTTFLQRFTRKLRELGSVEMRHEVLDVLLGLAAADGEISFEEVTTLRNLTNALGLSQQHYNELQAKYRDKLHFVS